MPCDDIAPFPNLGVRLLQTALRLLLVEVKGSSSGQG